MDVQWYPGHMTRAKRQLQDRMKQVEFILEVLDARAPHSSLNPDLEDMFGRKQVLYVLNKADLADPRVTKEWLAWFSGLGKDAFAYSVLKDSRDDMLQAIDRACAPMLEKYEQKGIHKTVRALVAGVPNVGKSALLNKLIGTKRMQEGDRPGVTKSLQWGKVGPYLEILDSPGMLWPKFEDKKTGAALALVGSIKTEILDEEELAMYLLDFLAVSEPAALKERYDITGEEHDGYERLEQVCARRGFKQRGGVFDTERGARAVLDEFRSGRLGRVSLEVPAEFNDAKGGRGAGPAL